MIALAGRRLVSVFPCSLCVFFRQHSKLTMSRLPLMFLSTYSEAEEAHARLAEAATKLGASEACCRELEGKLSLLQKKSENALGEERLKVLRRDLPGKCARSDHEGICECRVIFAPRGAFFTRRCALRWLHSTRFFDRHLCSPRRRLRLRQQGEGRQTWSLMYGVAVRLSYSR